MKFIVMKTVPCICAFPKKQQMELDGHEKIYTPLYPH